MAGDGECPAIGIDLGTTYSCVAVWRHDRVEIIPNEQGNRTTPSCVAFTDKERLIGDSAKNQIALNPSNTIFDAKRLIGRRFSDTQVQDDMKLWPFKIVEGTNDKPNIVVTYKSQKKKFAAEEISSMVLSKMKEIAEKYLGRKVKNAVITVPAYFNDSQRQATKDAGTVAGLEVMRVINEPTAAAIAYGLEKESSITKKTNVLVFDLGGGTFDVSVLTIDGAGKFEVKAVAGDTHLGGQDFDHRMVKHMVKQFLRKHKKDISRDSKALARLVTSCEQAKRVLSSSTETQIAIDCLHEGIDFSMKITHRKFEELNIELFDRCLETVGECLNEAKIDKKAVDEVVLVGGSTRIPKVQQMLKAYFDGKELCHSVNADEGVAYGAAIMAATLSGKGSQMVQDSLLVDVTPLSLGIEIYGDMVSVIIPRNTPIPTKGLALFRTIKDNQSEVDIKVYQGEGTKPCDNYLLDEFTLYGLPPGRRGATCLLVCFEIDVNGILTVSATEISTGAEENITIANARGRISAKEIEQMVEQADMFKLEDQQYREKVEAYQKLQNYAQLTRNKIMSGDTTAMIKPHPRAQKMEDAIEEVLKWLDMNRESGADVFARKLEELKYICDDVNTQGLD